MDYILPFIATHRDGDTRLFYTVEEFLMFAFDCRHRVGAFWLEHRPYYGSERLIRVEADSYFYRDVPPNDWIVRDDRGRPVDKETLGEAKCRRPYWSYGRWEDARRAAERGLPIPGTGQRRRWRSSKKWTKNGRNGAHNQRKGIRLYEDPLIDDRMFDDF